MSNTGSKKLPTLRDPKDPEQVMVYMREVREIIRALHQKLAEYETRISALE
jgi:predicted component of type VI protein secretion system